MKHRLVEVPLLTSEAQFRGHNALELSSKPFERSFYFAFGDFLDFREAMIKRIDKEKITSSFVELRELGASLRSLIMQPENLDEILSDFQSKTQIKKESPPLEPPNLNDQPSDPISHVNVLQASDFLNQNQNQKKSPKNPEILALASQTKNEEEVTDQDVELRNEENLKKILGNLELYISSNLKEIKDFRDAMLKQDKALHLNPSANKFPDESYENTPLAQATANDRATFLKKIANLQEENVNVFMKDLDKLTEEISLIENKANQMEINKLIEKIKFLTSKEEKTLEEITNIEKSIQRINDLPQRMSFFLKVRVSGYFNDEEINRNVTDYLLGFEYNEELLTINDEILTFRHSFQDEEPFFQFEYASISDIIQIFNNKFTTNIFLPEEKKEEKKKYESEFNHLQFSGFQIKFWGEGSLKAIYLKCDSFEAFQKLDLVFFIFNLRRSLRPGEFLYKNPKLLFLNGHEEIGSFSQSSLPKIQSNANIVNENLEIVSPQRKEKKSILNFEGGGPTSGKKKKVTHFHLNETKNNSNMMVESTHKLEFRSEEMRKSEEAKKEERAKPISFDPEANYQNYLQDRKDSVMEIQDSKQRLLELELAEKELREKKEQIYSDPEYQFIKARKCLLLGSVFLKYGKMGDPHERLIILTMDKSNGKPYLESRPFTTARNKKNFELDKFQEVKFDYTGGNFQRFKPDKNNEKLRFSIIFKGSKRLDLEAGNDITKKAFLESLEIFLGRLGGREDF